MDRLVRSVTSSLWAEGLNAASPRSPANHLCTRPWLADSGSECHEWLRLSLCLRRAIPPSKVGGVGRSRHAKLLGLRRKGRFLWHGIAKP